MHSRIFEISSTPVDVNDRLTEYAVPEWFCNSIADYVDTVAEDNRQEELDWFVSRFAGNCERDEDKLTFNARTQEDYFRYDYAKFREALSVLMAMDLETFSGKRYSPSLGEAMYTVESRYDDRFGFYVYDQDREELMTLDNWVRHMDVAKLYYVGGVVDYHF